MWIFTLLVLGLVVATAVFGWEVRKMWRARRRRAATLAAPRVVPTAVPRLIAVPEPAPVTIPPSGDRWCRSSWVDPPEESCFPRRQRDTPMLSEIIRRPPPSMQPGAIHAASRPGEIVAPEAIPLAPPLPSPAPPFEDGEEITFQRAGMFSMEIDLEDLLDTQPSVVLTAEEAEELLGRPTDPIGKAV